MPPSHYSVKTIFLVPFQAFPVVIPLCMSLCKSRGEQNFRKASFSITAICIFDFAQLLPTRLHQNFALTFVNALLTLLASTVERVGTIKRADPN